MAEIPSKFKPYVVSIEGLSYATDSDEYGLPDMRWWGAGSVTLSGWLKVRVKYSTKAGELISQDDYVIESGQTRTFSNPSGQDMVVFLLETEPVVKYSCPYCPATFDTLKELNAHIESEHPGEPPPGPGIAGIHLMFGVDEGQDFDDVANAGVNLVFDYGQHGKTFLDLAEDAGIYGLINLKFLTSNLMASKSSEEQWSIWANQKTAVKDIINDVKDHPALYGYYILEEPNLTGRGIDYGLQKAIYDYVKSVDPDHYVTFSMAGGPGDLGYDSINFNACDFIIPDTYGFGGPGSGGLTDLNFAASSLRSYLDDNAIDIPVVFTIQACSGPGTGWQTHIRDQIDILETHDVATGGVGMWAWNLQEGGGSDDTTFDEILEAWGLSDWGPPLPVYTCPYCGAIFATQTDLDGHIATVHPVPVFTCPYCGAIFATQTDLDGHIATVHPVPVFTCPHCGATFATQGELDDHIESQHPIAVEVPWYKKYAPVLGIAGSILGGVAVGTALAKRKK